MERILAAIDFSDCSRRALQLAFDVSRAFQAPLRVLYVVPEVFGHLRASEHVLPVSPEASKLEREMTDLILEEFKGAVEDFSRIEKKMREGVDYLEILKEAEAWHPSVLIVGTHGRSAVGKLFVGSVSDKVLRQAHTSVLLVPEAAAVQPRRVMAALAGDETAEGVLRTSLHWSRALGAELSLVHVADERLEPGLAKMYPGEELARGLDALRKTAHDQIDAAVRKVFAGEAAPAVAERRGAPFLEIGAAAEAARAELVVVGAGRGPYLGVTAARVVHSSRVPVLVARPARATAPVEEA
jgi:nucleotide-binding universal stress UspA family protein